MIKDVSGGNGRAGVGVEQAEAQVKIQTLGEARSHRVRTPSINFALNNYKLWRNFNQFIVKVENFIMVNNVKIKKDKMNSPSTFTLCCGKSNDWNSFSEPGIREGLAVKWRDINGKSRVTKLRAGEEIKGKM